MKTRLYFLFCLFIPSEQNYRINWRVYNDRENAGGVLQRLNQLMLDIYHDVAQRMTDYNHERFTYEETSEYQQGYVFHEIMERYRKIVMLMKKVVEYKSNTVYDNVDKNEKIQRLYFEIYNFNKYLRLIPQLTYPEDKDVDLQSYKKEKDQITMFKKEYLDREKERRETLKKEKRKKKKLKHPGVKITKKEQLAQLIAQLNATGNLTGDAGNKFLGQYIADAKSKVQRKPWMMDYGWDIEYWD